LRNLIESVPPITPEQAQVVRARIAQLRKRNPQAAEFAECTLRAVEWRDRVTTAVQFIGRVLKGKAL